MVTSKDNSPDPANGEIVLYSSPGGDVRVECLLREETIWLTQQQIAELFGVDKSGVSRHLKNIYDEGELVRESVVAKIATTAADGKSYQVEYHTHISKKRV
ncbi:MAG: ArsR family transcriptional regulator [Phycisphaerae bacterium]|nr:ArsR family transcriptional regulator [Phycisphaerae bacterium]